MHFCGRDHKKEDLAGRKMRARIELLNLEPWNQWNLKLGKNGYIRTRITLQGYRIRENILFKFGQDRYDGWREQTYKEAVDRIWTDP